MRFPAVCFAPARCMYMVQFVKFVPNKQRKSLQDLFAHFLSHDFDVIGSCDVLMLIERKDFGRD